MALEDIYTSQIRGRNVIPHCPSNFGTSCGIPMERERDPKLIQLENTVFGQMAQILEELAPTPSAVTKIQQSNFVSVEQAIKELQEMGEL